MSDEMAGCFAFGIIIIVVLGGIFGISVIGDSVSCARKWADFDHRYSIMGGCQVNIDGKWIPEDRVRETNI